LCCLTGTDPDPRAQWWVKLLAECLVVLPLLGVDVLAIQAFRTASTSASLKQRSTWWWFVVGVSMALPFPLLFAFFLLLND
jgi:hypothetical protein